MTPRFPGCDTTYFGEGQTYGPLPDHGYTNLKVVLHTTETVGMPGFGTDGSTAPHYVYDATNKDWYVWADVDERVGTLKGHSTNHCNDDSIQVEILGYSDGRWSPWVGDFDDTDYNELARFFKWAIDEGLVDDGVTVEPAGGWQYGTSSPYRMTNSEWHAFSGLTAHGNAPQNTHWDTGVLDLQRIHDLALQEEPDMIYQIGNHYPTYEEITWLLYEAAGGIINVNATAADQLQPVLGKDDPTLVTEDDFDYLAGLLSMSDFQSDKLHNEGLFALGKEIAALRSLTYD